jgi:hypothetical protein
LAELLCLLSVLIGKTVVQDRHRAVKLRPLSAPLGPGSLLKAGHALSPQLLSLSLSFRLPALVVAALYETGQFRLGCFGAAR